MGYGIFLEPLVVVILLFGGTWINREPDVSRLTFRSNSFTNPAPASQDTLLLSRGVSMLEPSDGDDELEQKNVRVSRSLSPSLLPHREEQWRKREIRLLYWKKEISTPNTAVFRSRFMSRLLQRFPFLVECWYWALVYWVSARLLIIFFFAINNNNIFCIMQTYQLGRAFTAVTLEDATVATARKHALQLINRERALHIFWELPIQKAFMHHPHLMTWTNWLYSFIHIPGTIAFLVWLYHYTRIQNRVKERVGPPAKLGGHKAATSTSVSPAGLGLYEARRRTLATCNLLAFVIFTLWPCMPPRLLSDEHVEGAIGELSRSYGFVDTVHGVPGASSVWTQNRFCNQYGQ